MKRQLSISLGVLALALALAGCGKAPEGIPVTYPLKKCVISGEAFGGEMGAPVKVSHEATDVYLCCKHCIADFQKDPSKYAQMVRDAQKK